VSGPLAGRAAVVTGGAMGLGRAIVERFATEGAQVVTIDRAAEDLEQTTRELDVVAVEGDVTREEDVERLFALVHERFGRLSVLVNNVGFGIEASVEETTPAQWHHVLDTCLTSYYLCARRALPLLRGAAGPAIVNVSSIQGLDGYPRFAAYAAAKGAIISLSRQMANDFGPSGIRVNALCPGTMLTPGARAWLDEQPDPELTLRDLSRWPALRRVGDPAEVAAAALWLASDEASYVTGHALVVDGGASVVAYDATPPEAPSP
jgi:NAD(P)-dependent dehydrogenase (short-subunit alcohol dehydrogenase family)